MMFELIDEQLLLNIDFNINNIIKKIIKITYKITKNKIKRPVNIIFVNKDEIKKINFKYRNINRETDVISFAFDENGLFNPIIGEIYLCVEVIAEQAIEYNHSVKREFSFLLIHGLLHILGYDHINIEDEKVMFDLQRKILDKIKMERK